MSPDDSRNNAVDQTSARTFANKRDTLVSEFLKGTKKFRHILALLYDEDMETRFLGAKVLGEVTRLKPECIRTKWYRLFCSFGDTMSCWGVAEGLGEIGRNLPESRGKIALLLKRFRNDRVTCQGYVWAVCRIGQVDRNQMKSAISGLGGFLMSADDDIVGQTIWAIGELDLRDLCGRLKPLSGDPGTVRIYDHETVRSAPIARLVGEAYEKIGECQ